jgi:hypothetical protein
LRLLLAECHIKAEIALCAYAHVVQMTNLNLGDLRRFCLYVTRCISCEFSTFRAQPKGEILMPMKAEAEEDSPAATQAAAPTFTIPAPVDAPPAPSTALAESPVPAPEPDRSGEEGDVLKLLAEEEA